MENSVNSSLDITKHKVTSDCSIFNLYTNFRMNNQGKSNYIIERHITRDNKSTWYLNKKPSSQKVVRIVILSNGL